MCSFLVTTPHHIPHTDLVENECSTNAKTPSLMHSELDGLFYFAYYIVYSQGIVSIGDRIKEL